MIPKIIGWLILIPLIVAIIIGYLFYLTGQRRTTIVIAVVNSLIIIGSSLFLATLFRFALVLILD